MTEIKKNYVLVTGGLGYIGSHVCVKLIEAGYDVLIVDDLSNSHRKVLHSIQKITGVEPLFFLGNLSDASFVKSMFTGRNIDFVIHLAGSKSVPQSVQQPILYYINNLYCTMILLNTMIEHKCLKLIYSSSAAVYDTSTATSPFLESDPIGSGIASPYGKTKYFAEELIKDVVTSQHATFSAIVFRYFNPIGAHPSGFLNECPRGDPNNLYPIMIQKLMHKKSGCLSIYGKEFDTKDGTAIRDFVHVEDIAEAHVQAAQQKLSTPGFHVYNLGTGEGTTVLELIETFQKVNNVITPLNKLLFLEPRSGDVPVLYANVQKAQKELGWKSKRKLQDMCEYVSVPKILILGYKGHGKDTAAEFLCKEFNMCFVSSSLFCAELVVMPALQAQGIHYKNVEECFADRDKHRAKWYDAIANFNKDDPARLGRCIFEEYDIYCGLRNVKEAKAICEKGLYDLAIWIDSSARGLPPESSDSCTVTPADADVVVQNDSSLDVFYDKLWEVMRKYFPSFYFSTQQPPNHSKHVGPVDEFFVKSKFTTLNEAKHAESTHSPPIKSSITHEMKMYRIYFDQVINGQKTATIRKGLRDMHVGDFICMSVTENPDVTVLVKIIDVRFSSLDQLTEEDAKKDNFQSLEEFKKAFLDIYKCDLNVPVTIISFIKQFVE